MSSFDFDSNSSDADAKDQKSVKHGESDWNRECVLPIGVITPTPEKEDASYNRTGVAADGKTVTIGPFELTASHIKEWALKTSPDELGRLVEARQMRSSTARTAQSDQFASMLKVLESGQTLPETMIERFFPGDLQRAVASKVLKK